MLLPVAERPVVVLQQLMVGERLAVHLALGHAEEHDDRAAQLVAGPGPGTARSRRRHGGADAGPATGAGTAQHDLARAAARRAGW